MAFVPIYMLILGFTIIIDYFAGIYIEQSEGKRRRLFLVMSLVANIGVLAVFKYYNFINDNITWLLKGFALQNPIPYLHILLPIGLSFHTFQAMSYTIEVYRGHEKAERHFGIYSLYVMFYPQLVAGPIERPQNVLHQFHENYDFDYQRVTDGLKLMAWGMFKKVVIADRLASMVGQVYDHPYQYTGIPLLVATALFSIQIFCDFSGYSDIALGSAQVMGFTLMKNFDRPYFSKTISEFWRRWHISLSTWFRDYLYISLGGNRVSKWRKEFNLFVVFLVSGIWHGASWNFIIWGAIHGFYLIFANQTAHIRNTIVQQIGIKKWPTFYKIVQIATVFGLTSFAWIFFRAKDFATASYIVTHLFTGFPQQLHQLANWAFITDNIMLGKGVFNFVIALLAIALMETVHLLQRGQQLRDIIRQKPRYVRWALYYGIIFATLFMGMYQSQAQFIYFQF
ncbi:MBOAT family O-acyltransferase [Flectobacillus major]|jgi:D-alanyl-lipoteichoic acid acyltransferase DltB (MBOAT superfamily)|uniref:MBOAT family O-acyltransferase n=1 Tax=Flectobacillus major TaxID=103 RepID=UPI0003FEC92D|nr:MBOAT family O-acyltransferase [Flectobacillus major]